MRKSYSLSRNYIKICFILKAQPDSFVVRFKTLQDFDLLVARLISEQIYLTPAFCLVSLIWVPNIFCIMDLNLSKYKCRMYCSDTKEI